MPLIASSFPSQTVLAGGPTAVLPGIKIGSKAQRVMIYAIHGADSNTLVLVAYRRKRGKLIRIASSAPTGKIIGTPAICYFRDNRIVTASHGLNSNRLFLICWHVDVDGGDVTITRKGDSGDLLGTPNGTADLVWIGGRDIAVAAKTEGDDLKLFKFRIHGNDSFERLSDSGTAAGEISSSPSLAWVGPLGALFGPDFGQDSGLPRVNALNEDGIVISAFRSSTGRLKLISWNVANDRVHRLSDTGNDGLEMDGRPAITAWTRRGIVAVAAKGRAATYNIFGWEIDGNGHFFNEKSRDSITNTDEVAITDSPAITFLPNRAGEGRLAIVSAKTEGFQGGGNGIIVDFWRIQRFDGPAGSLKDFKLKQRLKTNLRGTGSPAVSPTVLGAIRTRENKRGFPPGVYTAIRLDNRGLALHRWKQG